MPLNSIRTLMESISASYKSYFGMLYAENKIEELKNEFRKYELTIHFITVVVFGCTNKVLVSFVLYTSGVHDVTIKIIYLQYALLLLML